jgi:hypothetical protein
VAQARLPGTVAAPADARRALVRAAGRLRRARSALETCREAVREVREELAALEERRAAGEGAIESAGDDDGAAALARVGHVAAVRAVREAEGRAEGARRALREARAAVRLAERERRTAEDELDASEGAR